MIRPLSLAALAFIPSCATQPTVQDDVAKKLQPGLYDYTSPRTSDISGIKVPILRASELEARYGKPIYSVMSDGSYIAWQKAGKYELEIIGTPRSGIFRSSNPEGTVTILGQSTGAFGTGNETTEWTTNPVRLTHPDGRSANYFVKYGNPSGNLNLNPFPLLTW